MQTTTTTDLDDELDEEEFDEEEAKAPAARRRASSESDALAAFQAGRSAYAASQPETGHPADLHADLVRDWHDGWRSAATEANQGRGVRIATPFDPAERCITRLRACTYGHLQREPNDNPRTRYLDYPLDMHALIGSTWRNLYTAGAIQVGPIRADGWGHPHLCEPPSDTHGNPRRPHLRSVGFWTGSRFVVEHWIRVDHWTPAEVFSWCVVAVAYHRDCVAEAQGTTLWRSGVQLETKHLHAAWSEPQIWAILARWRINPHPAYRLGWGRVSCAGCIFGSDDQWASLRVVNPAQFRQIASHEQAFGCTIRRDRTTVGHTADHGTPYPSITPALVAEALNPRWSGAIFLPPSVPWTLPAGAFGDHAGPM